MKQTINRKNLSILVLVYLFGCGVYNDKYYNTREVDSLPKIAYMGMMKNFQPNVQIINQDKVYIIDSLLSVYIEDNINCPNLCEGLFRYKISLMINKKGNIEKVDIINCNDQIMIDLIIETLKRLKVIPAIKGRNYVSIAITVFVYVDLYNQTSKIKQQLIKI